MEKKSILSSYLRIRKLIGTLGILLPILVFTFHKDLLASISHYYYTESAVFFIAILAAFGFFLISYRGYDKDPSIDTLSDNIITNISGFAVLIVVLVPTSCSDSGSDTITNMICSTENFPMFGHNESLWNTIHLVSAAVFLFTMGWMSIFRFTRTTRKEEKKVENMIYKCCGYIVWLCIGILLIQFIGAKFEVNLHVSTYDVFILETVSVAAFGLSWLIKGKALKDIVEINKAMFGSKKK
ncbi:MAG: hypothetical protein JXQ93_01760 [Flavobacteriaceae bacterium]